MNKIMTHVVAGYPSEKECGDLLLGMQKAGVNMIEVQIPFSDPIADGETIMIANDKALAHGMTTQKSFDLIRAARKAGLDTEVYIMSYSQKLISYGIDNFCKQAESAGAKGLIIPDLPFDAGEYEALRKSADKNNLQIVPVISPGISEARLKKNLSEAKDLIYLTSIKGITGNKLNADLSLEKLAKRIKKFNPDTRLAIGFGINTRKDVDEVLKIADIAVVGSSVIRKIKDSDIQGAIRLIRDLAL